MRRGISAAAAATMLLVLLWSAGPATATAAGDPVRQVNHGDPYAACTIGASPGAVNYPATEIEPSVAVGPSGHDVIGAFQQDRWSDGGAKGLAAVWSRDGGRHFGETTLPFSSCAPGGLPYDRASDPWVSIGPDGTAYASGLFFNALTPDNGVAGAVSHDGGRSWAHLVTLILDTEAEFIDDKNAVTADPVHAGTAYQVWDRLDLGPGADGSRFTGPALLAVTHDFGRTYGAPRVIVDTAPNQQTIGNIILVDRRTGTLYDSFDLITYTDPSASTVLSANFSVVRSKDGGRTWTRPVTAAADTSILDVAPNTGAPLRTGGGLPEVAIDPRTGALYMVYEGTDFTGGQLDQIQLVHSSNGGRTWSRPIRVNTVPGVEAVTPSVAVGADGTVAVTYHDFRTLRPGNTTTLPTSSWLITSPRGARAFGHERPIAPPFDFLQAPVARGLFLGDYEGLAAQDGGFRTLFAVANSGQPDNRTDLLSGLLSASRKGAVAAAATGTATATAGAGAAAPARPGRVVRR